MEMNVQTTTLTTTLQGAENDLKQLMADVTRATEKAQEAIAKMVSKTAAATAETKSTTSSR
jgi:ABC-type Fe3+-hydroxamate transport system substrate-binding protein